MNRPVRIPEANNSMTTGPEPARVVVTVAGKVIADTVRALALGEAPEAQIFYIPREDVDMALLERTYATYSTDRGECAYYSIPIGGARSVDAAWSYEAPGDASAAIRNRLAFAPNRVDAIVEWPAP